MVGVMLVIILALPIVMAWKEFGAWSLVVVPAVAAALVAFVGAVAAGLVAIETWWRERAWEWDRRSRDAS